MFTDHAKSQQIASWAAQVKRAATAIRAVLTGRESFMQTSRDMDAYRLDLTEQEVNTLQDAARILENLHKQRRNDAAKQKAAEQAFKAREDAAYKEAAALFDSWNLDVAGWLVLIYGDNWSHLRDANSLAGEWDSAKRYARDSILSTVAFNAAKGNGTVEELLHRERVYRALARHCDQVEEAAARVTTALVARRLELASQPAGPM
jgi:hypothetical protein